MEENLISLNQSLKNLKEQLERIDKLENDRRKAKYFNNESPIFELIVKKSIPLIFRMSKDKNHKRPHLHLDIGKDRHAVSICINTLEILAGNIETKYHRQVFNWISSNIEELQTIWNALQNDQKVSLENLN